jgi:hypothetical protein
MRYVGALAELKTQRSDVDVDEFLDGIDDDQKREDAHRIRAMMAELTGDPGAMWGESIVGFGSYRYRYSSGREGEWFKTGFAPRKQNLTLYVMAGFEGYGDLMSRLGKHSTGKSCLYVKRLANVDEAVLRELIAASVEHIEATNPA